MTTRDRLTRTYLAAPAHRLRLVESAARSAADAVFIDLEDAVPAAGKAAALDAACSALAELDWGDKTVAVRINAYGSPTIADEIARLALQPRLDVLLLPKAERAAEVAEVCDLIEAARSRVAHKPVELDLLVESALGLVNVDALAQVDARLGALHLGVGDFAASIGARTVEIGGTPPGYRETSRPAVEGEPYRETPLDLFAYPMMRLLVAARAFGLRAIDGPCGAYQDALLSKAWAEKAAALGFDGKHVIHPTQIAATRDAFVPSPAELAYARRVIDAMREGAAAGRGAVSVDGKMIDLANVRMAERIVRLGS